MSGPPRIDWNAGDYETLADDLVPPRSASSRSPARGRQDRARHRPWHRNAALIAADAGAVVSDVDSADRLVDVANARAAERGVPASFTVADAQELPFADGAFDIVVSVFGVVFAPDARQALGEALRRAHARAAGRCCRHGARAAQSTQWRA